MGEIPADHATLKTKFEKIEKQNVDFCWFGSTDDEYDRVLVVRYFIRRKDNRNNGHFEFLISAMQCKQFSDLGWSQS